KEPPKKEETEGSVQMVNAKKEEPKKAEEIVFIVEGDTAKSRVVETGISDDTYLEITSGLKEGEEIVSGGYAAVSRLLEDGKKIKKEDPKDKKAEEKKA